MEGCKHQLFGISDHITVYCTKYKEKILCTINIRVYGKCTHLSALLQDLLGLNPKDGVEGVGEHVPRGERVLEEGVGLAPLLARHSLFKKMK